MKADRQNKILEIVENTSIETQEELIELLSAAGFSVTQATISRDIRELKLTKVLCESGKYKYVVQKDSENDGSHLYNKALSGSIRSVESSLNVIVIKTYPGLASPVAAGIDSLGESDVLGCVAGDDTVLVVIRSRENAPAVCKMIRSLSKE